MLRDAFDNYEIVEGFFEKETKLDDFGRASQTDLLLLIRAEARLAVVGVEGKAKETFGPLVSNWNGNPQRLQSLCAHLSLDPDDISDIPYQLLHRTVATLLEAKRYGATEAIMLVHSFDPDDASLGDYQAFATRLGLSGAELDTVTSAKILGAIKLRLAWAKQP